MSQMTIAQALALAMQHWQASRPADAEAIHLQVLRAEPDHVEALHFLALVSYQANHADEAVGLLRRAIAVKPSVAALHCNMGRILAETGQSASAIASYREALRIDPRNA